VVCTSFCGGALPGCALRQRRRRCAQVLAFEAYVGASSGVLATNARPLQPLGGREPDFDDFA